MAADPEHPRKSRRWWESPLTIAGQLERAMPTSRTIHRSKDDDKRPAQRDAQGH